MMKGIYKGFKYITQIFVVKEQEIEIGYPTDVKHVAHIGWDGPSGTGPSWMNEFKTAPDFSTSIGSFADRRDTNPTAVTSSRSTHEELSALQCLIRTCMARWSIGYSKRMETLFYYVLLTANKFKRYSSAIFIRDYEEGTGSQETGVANHIQKKPRRKKMKANSSPKSSSRQPRGAKSKATAYSELEQQKPVAQDNHSSWNREKDSPV